MLAQVCFARPDEHVSSVQELQVHAAERFFLLRRFVKMVNVRSEVGNRG